MPEGDTIFRTAKTLEKAIGGKVITGFRSTVAGVAGDGPVGRKVGGIEARGKNLLIHFDNGKILHTHLRMMGSWHIYRSGQRWRKPERQARVVIETADFVAVCFNAPVVKILEPEDVKRDPILGRLGPDLLDPDFDLAEARTRLRERNELTVGEALLVQSAVAGIGNVYKSETLFLSGTNPHIRVKDLADGDLDRILEKAAELMAQNLEGFPRTTRRSRGGGRHWVYGRRGRPCGRCGASIRMERQGLAGRSTYWCPTCQPERTVSPPAGPGPGTARSRPRGP